MEDLKISDDSWSGWPLGAPADCAEGEPEAEKPKIEKPPAPQPALRRVRSGQVGQTSSTPVVPDGPLIKKSGHIGQ